MAKSDFIDVRLNAYGAELAGVDGVISMHTPHFSYQFTATGKTRVLTSEWAKILSVEMINGQTILEVVEESAADTGSESEPANTTEGSL